LTRAVQLALLGPLELLVDGRPVELGAPKTRALLALLALRANRPVGAELLADELWDGRPPPSARKALQTHVVHLRRALGADRIATGPAGYTLQVGSDEHDLARFEQLLREGRDRLERGEPAAALPLLDAALALWRGAPAPDLADLAAARGALQRLDELHTLAWEARIDAALALGRHAELVPDLELAVRRDPLRERAAEQLMLALYRSGRQADALAVARGLRGRLREQLGLGPGRSLQALERAILNQDAGLDAPDVAMQEGRALTLALVGSAASPLVDVAGWLADAATDLVVARLVPAAEQLATGSSEVEALRERLPGARAAAFTSARPLEHAARLAREQGAALALVGVARAELAAAVGAPVTWPCTVALAADGDAPGDGAILLPFGGSEHEWAALELGIALARAAERPLRLLGARRGGEDASRLLANASLLAQRLAGVAAAPTVVEPGAASVVREAAGAGLVLLGAGPRGLLGTERQAVVAGSSVPVVCVLAGQRPGLLAPRHSWTAFGWSLES
jgi:DNA-binding SARP family transcriptional activator